MWPAHFGLEDLVLASQEHAEEISRSDETKDIMSEEARKALNRLIWHLLTLLPEIWNESNKSLARLADVEDEI